jgi:hypothetical protein
VQKETDRKTGREMNDIGCRQTDKQTGRQTDRQADKQIMDNCNLE